MTDLTERLRASVTYQYMPMDVRKLLSEAATTLETLTQENARLRAAGWRDIESAPRDTQILGYMPNRVEQGHPYIAVIWWDDEFRTDGWDYDADEVAYVGAWSAGRVGSFSYEEYAEEHPTHWMPLPPAPARKALGGGDE